MIKDYGNNKEILCIEEKFRTKYVEYFQRSWISYFYKFLLDENKLKKFRKHLERTEVQKDIDKIFEYYLRFFIELTS